MNPDALSANDIEAVRAKYGMSAAVEELSMGRESVRNGVTSALGGAVSTVDSPARPSEKYADPSRPVRKAKARYAGHQGHRAFVQELENANHQEPPGKATEPAPVDYEAGISGIDGGDHGLFQVTITLRYPDQLRRDPHGSAETILDCLVRARRRLLDPDPDLGDKKRTRSRKSRSHDHPAKTVKKWVPF